MYFANSRNGNKSSFTIVTSSIRALALPIVSALLLGAASVPARAEGLSAYLPLNLEPEIERQIERVLILADEPILKRPIAVELVRLALPQACKVDKPLCHRVERYLQRYSRDYALTHASITGSATHDKDDGTVPNEYGLPTKSHWDLSAQGFVQPTDYLLAQAGVVAYSGRTRTHGQRAGPRFQLGAARYRLPGSLVLSDDRQQHADEHRGPDHAVRDVLELRAPDEARVSV